MSRRRLVTRFAGAPPEGEHLAFEAHVDNAIRFSGPARYRTDLSATLFLSDPGEYEGGELVVEDASVSWLSGWGAPVTVTLEISAVMAASSAWAAPPPSAAAPAASARAARTPLAAR